MTEKSKFADDMNRVDRTWHGVTPHDVALRMLGDLEKLSGFRGPARHRYASRTKASSFEAALREAASIEVLPMRRLSLMSPTRRWSRRGRGAQGR